MLERDKRGQTTRCTAIPYERGKILLVETPTGLALPSGYAHWQYGFPEALYHLFRSEHDIGFRPETINSFIQHKTDEGDEVVNMTFIGGGTYRGGSKVRALTTRDALKEALPKHDRRALELYAGRHIGLPLEFISSTSGKEKPLPAICNEIPNEAQKPKDFIVSGGPIRYSNERDPAQYAFQELGKGTNMGAISFFGGKGEGRETPQRTLIRERGEESGNALVVEQIGMLGVRINNVIGQQQPNDYSVNFSIAGTISEKITEMPKRGGKETKRIIWLTLEELRNLPSEKLRTRDTRDLTELMEMIMKTGRKITPLEGVVESLK